MFAEGNATMPNGFGINGYTNGKIVKGSHSIAHRTNSEFATPIKQKPFVSTVTGGESKSRGSAGNRLTSTGHGLLFGKRPNR